MYLKSLSPFTTAPERKFPLAIKIHVQIKEKIKNPSETVLDLTPIHAAETHTMVSTQNSGAI